MNQTILIEIKALMSILGECLASFRSDFSNIDCKSSNALASKLIPSLIFKLEKIVECAKSINKICKSLKKDDIPCLPCLKGAVTKEPSK